MINTRDLFEGVLEAAHYKEGFIYCHPNTLKIADAENILTYRPSDTMGEMDYFYHGCQLITTKLIPEDESMFSTALIDFSEVEL